MNLLSSYHDEPRKHQKAFIFNCIALTGRFKWISPFAHYRRIASLREYVLISQDEPKIEKYTKDETGRWSLSETDDNNQQIVLEAVDCTLKLSDVYERVFD